MQKALTDISSLAERIKRIESLLNTNNSSQMWKPSQSRLSTTGSAVSPPSSGPIDADPDFIEVVAEVHHAEETPHHDQNMSIASVEETMPEVVTELTKNYQALTNQLL